MEEDIQMVNKNIKRCSKPLIVEIKITMSSHLTPIRMAINKKQR